MNTPVVNTVHTYAREFVALHAFAAARFGEVVGLQRQFWDDGFPHRNVVDWQEWPQRLTRVLGADHPDALQSRHSLAVCYTRVGRDDDALTLIEAVLADRVRVLGVDHPDTLHSRHSLAVSYDNVGRHADAATLRES